MTSTIPMSPDEITAPWLEEALRTRFPGARVKAMELLDRHAGTTGRARIGLSYEEQAGAPDSLFVKLPPDDEAQRQMVQVTGMGRKESRFYAELAAELPVRLPKPYFADYDESGAHYIMLIEDLVAKGCSFPKPGDANAMHHAREIVKGQAHFHAHLWESPRFEDELSWIERPLRSEIGPRLIEQALSMYGSEMPEIFTGLARLFVDHHGAVNDLWEEGETTLIHGDAHIGNLFQEGETIGFLDWAVLGRGPGMRDVSYTLCNSFEPELRRREERGLIETYRDTLLEAGVAAPDFETLWRRHRMHAVYSWVSATVTAAMGDKWQPLSVGMGSMKRTTQAAEDLGSLDLFRGELGL